MGTLPAIEGRGPYAALVVRTDYSDEAAWRCVAALLVQPWGDNREYEAIVHVVDDAAWDGVAPDDVRAMAGADEYLSVVFVADATTMLEPRHALLAVDIRWGDEEESEEPGPVRHAFRTEPAAIHEVHANLDVANMDFEEFAAEAGRDVDGVLRPFWAEERPGRDS